MDMGYKTEKVGSVQITEALKFFAKEFELYIESYGGTIDYFLAQ